MYIYIYIYNTTQIYVAGSSINTKHTLQRRIKKPAKLLRWSILRT